MAVCAECHRAVFDTDVDADGRCCFCPKVTTEPIATTKPVDETAAKAAKK